MKNVMVVNHQSKSKHGLEEFQTELKAQIENSLRVGWKPEDIIVIANFDFEFMGIKTTQFDLNKHCLTGSKMFAVSLIFKNNLAQEPIWAHDLDCWQTVWFDCPEFKDVGISTYSSSKYNGGSVFWKPSALDIIEEVLSEIRDDKLQREEPTLNKILKDNEYKDRVTALNNTMNVGCSGFVERFNRAKEYGLKNNTYYPLVCHMHPGNRIAYDTHCRDRNRINEIAVPKKLHDIFIKYFEDKIKRYTYQGERGYDGDWNPPFAMRDTW